LYSFVTSFLVNLNNNHKSIATPKPFLNHMFQSHIYYKFHLVGIKKNVDGFFFQKCMSILTMNIYFIFMSNNKIIYPYNCSDNDTLNWFMWTRYSVH
jgi:hypothetical protein